jgi:hypothetical protein
MDISELTHRLYLGDSVYVGHDGYHVWLYTDNGLDIVTNKIALEPAVLNAFDQWRKQNEPRIN